MEEFTLAVGPELERFPYTRVHGADRELFVFIVVGVFLHVVLEELSRIVVLHNRVDFLFT